MKIGSLTSAEVVLRPYGVMRMLAGGASMKTTCVDLRVLEIRPGAATTRHTHHRSESVFYVVHGRLEMDVGEPGVVVPLGAGDVILIEPGEVHCLRNVGDEEARVIEAMGPPFSKRDIFIRSRPDEPLSDRPGR